MANLTELFELDLTSAASNSNFAGANIAENCAPSGINNALRALGSMASRALNYKSGDISSSASTNIAATGTGIYMDVTGANAINSLGVIPGSMPTANPLRILQFDSSASLSHSNGTIALLGQNSRKTQPGDVAAFIHEGSGGWRELFYSRADGDRPFSPCFLAHRNGTDQVSITATAVKMTFGTEDFDVGGFLSDSTYSPTFIGKYRFTVSAWFTATNAVADEALTLSLYKNGGEHRKHVARRAGTSNQAVHVSWLADNDGNDIFEIYVAKSGAGQGGVFGTATDTFFCGEKI